MSPSELAVCIEHSLLKAEATPDQVDSLCDEAVAFGFAGVCVNPVNVRRAADRLASTTHAAPRKPFVVSVVGFPLGANTTVIKADEARRALDDGASEIDMVAALGSLISGDARSVRKDIEAVAKIVHRASPPAWLKVILEVGALTGEQIVAGCRACAEGEADFVKTSTGFHPAGGTTVDHVRTVHRLVTPIRVKAAGGIRTAGFALALIQAGAARIGTSVGPQIIADLQGDLA